MVEEKLKLIYKIVNDLERGKQPTNNDYEIDQELFGEMLDIIQLEGLVHGAVVQRAGRENKVMYVQTKNAKVTIPGLNYLKENKPQD
ncbi:YjcQ family protein [Lysinibacillus fusiformis]|uniref:YjcQ family protein n=1 Tax=Lysinibacillus fusiformis TaxID=28031 RepID=UPI0035C0465E